MLLCGEITRGWLCLHTTCMCQNIHTHPYTDLNAHIRKYRYIYFFTHPTVYREIKEILMIITTPTLHQGSKEPKSAIQKLSLTFSKLYSLSLQQ